MSTEVLTRRVGLSPASLPLFSAVSGAGTLPGRLILQSAEPSTLARERSLVVASSALRLQAWGCSVTVHALNENGRGALPTLVEALSMAGYDAVQEGVGFRITVPASVAVNEADRLVAPSPLGVVRIVHECLRPVGQHRPEALLIVGLFGYDLVESFEELPEPSGEGEGDTIPDFELYVADEVIVVDAQVASTTVVATVLPGEAQERVRNTARERVAELVAILGRTLPDTRFSDGDQGQVTVDVSDDEFARIVDDCKKHIMAGEVFQIVPSRTFSAPCTEPLAAFARLGVTNPSPYLFYGCFESFVLFGSSPESALRVEGDSRTVEISPIAGTRGRGRRPDGSIDPDMDSRVEAQLRLDAKESAEHMMLVDLARNDVARVCEPASRHVSELLRVVRYSHVMHLMSRVVGRLRPGLDALHAYQATMNMGTLTGAPKPRAMQLLRGYEQGRRGAYGGAIGYFGADGSLDSAIVIRSATVHGGTAHIRAGAGIVADSIPAHECEETRRKAEAVLRAVMPLPQPIGGRGTPVEVLDAHVIVVDNFDSFTYNLVDAFESLGARVEVFRNSITPDALRDEIERSRTRLVVLSPGPGTPASAGNLLDIIRVLDVPVLGVCLGHQGLAHAFGGVVGRATRVVHGQTSRVHTTGHEMFSGLPRSFDVARYHSLVATEVPAQFEVTASSDEGLVMAIAHKERPLYGVQFHPESILTSRGQTFLANILRLAHERSA